MNRADIINKLMLLSDKEMTNALNKIFLYENIRYSFDMFLDSTPVYSVFFKNPFTQKEENWLEPLRLQHMIPDFMIDNYTTFRREDSKLMTEFFMIFLVRIFVLNTLFTVKRNQNLYMSPLKNYQYSVNTINNRKNLEYFFKHFFRQKIEVVENIPERCSNFNQFKLGKNVLYSQYKDGMAGMGEYIYTSLHKYHVFLDLEFDELNELINCVWAINKTKLIILKSTENQKIKKRYKFCLSFVGTVLKGLQSILSHEVNYA